MRQRHPTRVTRPAGTAPEGTCALSDRMRNLLCGGIVVLVVAMFTMPSGPSFNPSQKYQYLVGITLYLPALILGFAKPSRWRVLLQRPLMPLLLVFLGWAAISLAWTNVARPLDEALRLLSILVFLFAWHHGIGGDVRRLRAVLVICAGALALVAVIAVVDFFLHPPADMRLKGFGVLANPNLMAACLATAILWLLPWTESTTRLRALKWFVIAVLLGCLLLTRSRSVLAAFFIAWMALALISPKHTGPRPITVLATALPCVALAHAVLLQRGWSLRPEILAQAWELFQRHPWSGLGLGARFVIPTSGLAQTHTHNLFAQLAVELGIPGVLLWTVLWLALGYRAWRQSAHTTARITLALWVFASVAVQFDLPHLIDSPRPGWLFLWFPLAMNLALSSATEKETNEDLVDRADLQLAAGTATGSGHRRSADTQTGRNRHRR